MKRLTKYFVLAFALTFIFSLAAGVQKAHADEDDLADRVYIDKNAYYSKDKDLYVYIVPEVDNAEISCTVADKMIVNGPVRVSFNLIYPVIMYKDGYIITPDDWENITEPGNYIVKIIGGGMNYNIISFTIVGDYTNLTRYVLPNNCEMVLCMLDDEEISTDFGVVDFTKEGRYYVEYSNTKSLQNHDFTTCVDHTAPLLRLDGVVDGIAKRAVSLADANPEDELIITLDGATYIPSGSSLGEVGNYYIRVTDPAGNSTEYNFKIVVSFDVYTILFLVVFTILVAVLITYLMIGRKTIKVR